LAALAPISEREQEDSSDSSEQSIELIPGSKIKPNLPIAAVKKHSKALLNAKTKPNAKTSSKTNAKMDGKTNAKPRGKPPTKGPQEVTQTKEADVTRGD